MSSTPPCERTELLLGASQSGPEPNKQSPPRSAQAARDPRSALWWRWVVLAFVVGFLVAARVVAGARGAAGRLRGLFDTPGGKEDGQLVEEWGLRFVKMRKHQAICSLKSPVPPAEALRKWQLSPAWRRVCEKKNRHWNAYARDRNWCWIGMKNMCHMNLKAHHSWETLQHMAAKRGIAPGVKDAPFSPIENPQLCDRPSSGGKRKWTDVELATARHWFRKMVKVYVLNLKSSTHRWEMISKRLQELEISFHRIIGVDMRIPGAYDEAKAAGWIPQEYNFEHAQNVSYSRKHNMGSILGTLGCASAHFKVQRTVMADGFPIALVFEDDSWPSDDFVPRLWSLVQEELPCDWEAAALLSRCPYGKCISPQLVRVQPDTNEPAWRCRQGVNWGMHGFLYRTSKLPSLHKIWKQTVFDEERPHCMDVDVALASISDRVSYYAVPAALDPGFLFETNHRSARWDINQIGRSTSLVPAKTTTTATTTTKPGIPAVAALGPGNHDGFIRTRVLEPQPDVPRTAEPI